MQKSRLYNRYQPALFPRPGASGQIWWLIFQENRLLVDIREDRVIFPDQAALADCRFNASQALYLGELDQHSCYCLMVGTSLTWPEHLAFQSLRALNGILDGTAFLLAGRAYQLLNWDRNTKFCGRCGAATQMKQDERAKICPVCGNLVYPRISPAVIVAILRGRKILLAHNRNFLPGLYSLIAGFMEPGEDFEDTAAREVREEVGLKICNIRYFDSQPWPFPDSLMVGFVADFASGEIQPDGEEIEDAAWFDLDELPEVPPETSIAGRLIRWVQREIGNNLFDGRC